MTEQEKLLQYLQTVADIARNAPEGNILTRRKYKTSFERREPTLTDYQHTENIVERHLKRDRRHPLPTALINNFNDKIGSNLDEVQIVYGPGANEYARSRHALAFAVLDTIYFRNGAYKPETEEGRKTIAHELTHVAQHKNRPLADNRTKEELETEAEIAADEECQETDHIITMNIMGISFRIKESQRTKVKDMIKEALKRQIEEYCLINNTDKARQLLEAYREAKFHGDIDEWLQ